MSGLDWFCFCNSIPALQSCGVWCISSVCLFWGASSWPNLSSSLQNFTISLCYNFTLTLIGRLQSLTLRLFASLPLRSARQVAASLHSRPWQTAAPPPARPTGCSPSPNSSRSCQCLQVHRKEKERNAREEELWESIDSTGHSSALDSTKSLDTLLMTDPLLTRIFWVFTCSTSCETFLCPTGCSNYCALTHWSDWSRKGFCVVASKGPYFSYYTLPIV